MLKIINIFCIADINSFYAIDYFQDAIGEQRDIAISQPSVSRYIRRVTDAINNLNLLRWVQFPMTDAERQKAWEKFRNARQPFIGAIGAIDCTYININTYINIKESKEHEKICESLMSVLVGPAPI